MPLRPDDYYAENGIDLRLRTNVAGIDVPGRTRRGSPTAAPSPTTGCCWRPAPSRSGLSIPGADLPHVHMLRSLADCRAIIAKAETARRAVVIGRELHRAGGRGLAARARTRGACGGAGEAADGAGPRPADGRLHPRAARGARRRLPPRGHGDRHRRQAGDAQAAAARSRRISSSPAIGVRPRDRARRSRPGSPSTAASASNAYLETSAPGIFAAGDIARWPDPHSGAAIRVEHWVVAERQGQTAARNMLGAPRDVRRRAVLLEPALRRADQLCRPRRALGRDRDRRRHRRQGLHACASSATSACSRSRRSSATSQASRPSSRWSRRRRNRAKSAVSLAGSPDLST